MKHFWTRADDTFFPPRYSLQWASVLLYNEKLLIIFHLMSGNVVAGAVHWSHYFEPDFETQKDLAVDF